MATWMLSRNSWRAAQSNALPTDIRHDVIDPRLALLMDSPFQASAMSAKLCRFIVPRMLPPTPFVGNSDILVPSPMVSFILRFPKQPQSTEKENENMPLSRMRVFSFTPWPCPDQTSGSSDNCRVTDVNLESQVTDPPQVRTYRCVGSVVKR